MLSENAPAMSPPLSHRSDRAQNRAMRAELTGYLTLSQAVAWSGIYIGVLERDQHCGKLAAEEIAGVALSRSTSMRLSGTRACRSRLRR
jgi:hypothetical protein